MLGIQVKMAIISWYVEIYERPPQEQTFVQ